VEVRLGERRLIFDAGSGLVPLAAAMAAEPGPVDVDLILSHTHYDHICGLPFSRPCSGREIKSASGLAHLTHGVPAETTLRASLNAPVNPTSARRSGPTSNFASSRRDRCWILAEA